MATQSILFTVLPRAMAVNTATLPVSVFVAPRLSGAQRLGAFPDWLDWTARCADNGLQLTLRCGAATRSFDIDPAPLRPALWRALFNQDTLVRPHQFEDYTDHAVMSYATRVALSVVKATYQEAGVALALPDRTGDATGYRGEKQDRRRWILKSLLDGLAINWNEADGEGLRARLRVAGNRLAATGSSPRYPLEWLSADGTFAVPPPGSTMSPSQLRSGVAQQFGVYSHLPAGTALDDKPQDLDTLIDFHQALSSLNSYPELLRALGIVFDLELPADFVATTSATAFGTLSVSDVPQRQWAIPTTTVPNAPPISTAYLHWHGTNPEFRLFTAAPAVLEGTTPNLDVFGLMLLDPQRYGLAQVDVESAMHKATLLAESWQDGRPAPAVPDRPDVFDETTTLTSLRSGGFSIYADGRATRLAQSFARQKQLNKDLTGTAPTTKALFAEDLLQGYRVDVWEATAGKWRSLHRRIAHFDVNGTDFDPAGVTEGFAQIAAAQPAPGAPASSAKDLYLNESMARWVGWSLSVPFPGKALSHDVDPEKALEPGALAAQNEPATPFKVRAQFRIAPQSLPALRFGRRYRFRLRAVDLAGNSLQHDDPVADLLALAGGLPRDGEGMPYLRFEPVDAPSVVLRDSAAVTDPGSGLDRLVIRTFNDGIAKDGDAAALDAADRHIVPPSTSVEMGERHGMFDKDGKPDPSAQMRALIAARDEGKLPTSTLTVAGKEQALPLVADAGIDALPYLPDVLSRGAAFRDLPGSAAFSVGRAAPGAGADAPIAFEPIQAANPRHGAATLVSFGGEHDWQRLQPFRLALADGDGPPRWNPADRVLTVELPKGSVTTVAMSSYLGVDDLKLMGVWQWLRERIDRHAVDSRDIPVADARLDSELVAHILQRAQEGGHWMLTPPRLLTLVHAVQQPLGQPGFAALPVQHVPYGTPRYPNAEPDESLNPDPKVLQTVSESAPTAATELAPVTAWRHLNSTDAFLLGGLKIHAGSTDRVELLAEWTDLVADPDGTKQSLQFNVTADDIPVPAAREGYIRVSPGKPQARNVAYYDADHDMLCFARHGDQLGNLRSGVVISGDTAPRHRIGDTRRQRITYTARATSRFREYFAFAGTAPDFTRTSEPVVVDVPASARPVPPAVSHVVPSFAWQRQTDSNVKRSVRFGGGLRIYLDRPWFSSGDGELLGVALYDYGNGPLDNSARERWKGHVTQWGADPIWKAQGVAAIPTRSELLNAYAAEASLSVPRPAPGRVDVAGYEVAFDDDMNKWFADITIDTRSAAYTPFVRLALLRYQPMALADAKLSAPVIADYIQLTPQRAAVVSADPYRPRSLRVTVSGPAPAGPLPAIPAIPTVPVARPTLVTVTVQQLDAALGTDLGWHDAPGLATVTPGDRAPDDILRWTGSVTFAQLPPQGTCRLLIREYEYLSANWVEDSTATRRRRLRDGPKRLVYAETVTIDAALIGPPTSGAGTTPDE